MEKDQTYIKQREGSAPTNNSASISVSVSDSNEDIQCDDESGGAKDLQNKYHNAGPFLFYT